jgi:hypothetical protein
MRSNRWDARRQVGRRGRHLSVGGPYHVGHVGTRHYLHELARPSAPAQDKRMGALTRSMNRLSVVGVGVGIVGAILAAMTFSG